jgi:hypothetical protein
MRPKRLRTTVHVQPELSKKRCLMPPRKPKAAPATTTILRDELKEYQKEYGTDLVEIVNATTIIVWNSRAQRDRLSRKVRRNGR